MANKDEFKNLHFPDAPKIVVEPPGPKARALLDEYSKKFEGTTPYPPRDPEQINYTTAWDSAKGATIKDVDGNIFVDLGAGISVFNIGHCNPVVVKVLKEQAEKLWHGRPMTTHRLKYAERINDIAPGEMRNNVRLVEGTSGTDIDTAAINVCRFIKKKKTLIAFENAFHGAQGLINVTCQRYSEGVPSTMPYIYRLPYAYCYRCPFNLEYPECDLKCLYFIEHCFKDPGSGLVDPAAMIVEPLQGEGGYIIPPDEFLPGLRRICDENNVLMIVDEIQTGFGRTGKMWACEHWDVTPDVMTIGKAAACGMSGFAQALFKREILEGIKKIPVMGTFRSNTLALAVAAENLAYFKKHDFPRRARELGKYFLRYLTDLQEGSKIIGDVRGKGLWVGVELVKDRKTKEPAAEIVKTISRKMFKKGFVVYSCGVWHQVIRFMPSLIITRELIDKTAEAFTEVILEVEKEMK